MKTLDVGARIKIYRYENGLSQDELANQLNISQPSVQRLETGKQGISSKVASRLIKLGIIKSEDLI